MSNVSDARTIPVLDFSGYNSDPDSRRRFLESSGAQHAMWVSSISKADIAAVKLEILVAPDAGVQGRFPMNQDDA
ncbi:hypothetical protein [Mesorhizobium sp. WSM3224]|uniref:hypothetical protein n=1 Tax=Mesorhizobium sp. WSM3224 TaxID=1040986 RepID=UPI0012EC4C3F|nr:hypothetical protein [Mesorhizobium sp. WSM3224]